MRRRRIGDKVASGVPSFAQAGGVDVVVDAVGLLLQQTRRRGLGDQGIVVILLD